MSATAVMIALRLAGPGVALALSAVSLIRSDAWRLWVDLLTRALQSDLLDFWFFTWTFRVLSSPWLLILPAFLLLGLASLGTRSGRWHNTIFIACFFAQFPGLLSHTTFQWLRLISSDLVITPQPGIVPVAAALLSLPVAYFSLRAASVMEETAEWLQAGNVDPADIEAAYRANGVFVGGALAAVALVSVVVVLSAYGISIWLGAVRGSVGGYWFVWAMPVAVALLAAVLYGTVRGRTLPVAAARVEQREGPAAE